MFGAGGRRCELPRADATRPGSPGYRFECVGEPPSWMRQLHAIGECFSGWGLTRVYNPGALQRQPFFRPYHYLWISRDALVGQYGDGAPPRRPTAGDVC